MFRLVCKRSHHSEAFASFLATKRVADLKDIAVNSGVLTGGVKSDLVERLATHLSTPTQSKSIISFDLGYRNLAYCHLNANREILDWARVDLNLTTFHPSTVAPVVRQFIKDRVLCNLEKADRVLIEQQRARSNGSFNVLETTLRVNCVEAILWCGLYESVDSVENKVELTPVLRQSVDRAWQKEIDQTIQDNPTKFKVTEGASYRQKKLAGVEMVSKWLETDTVVSCSDALKEMFEAQKKKDDLSDCLVQALTWYKWEDYSKSILLPKEAWCSEI